MTPIASAKVSDKVVLSSAICRFKRCLGAFKMEGEKKKMKGKGRRRIFPRKKELKTIGNRWDMYVHRFELGMHYKYPVGDNSAPG